jgi:uncharacterized protein with HEPN domain
MDMNVIWATVQDDVPALIAALEAELADGWRCGSASDN